jgi:hypothetical protein
MSLLVGLPGALVDKSGVGIIIIITTTTALHIHPGDE